jgi:FG-GAP-like repeat/FG-GAP repeat
VIDGASPARACRRRRSPAAFAALLACSLTSASPAAASTARPATPAASSADVRVAAAPTCSAPGTGWCRARRIAGLVPKGELGFRFGEPLDVDGDGRADVAAGARFTLQDTYQSGSALVWSGADGRLIRAWNGDRSDGLFGHWVLPVPDVSGDGLADVVITAPHALVAGRMRGVVVARSPKTGAELWKREETESENLGWDLSLAGDQDGDGHPDLFVGAPAETSGRVYLLSGETGAVLRTYAPAGDLGSFGWYVARTDDLDRDGKPDLVVGAPFARSAGGDALGVATVLSSSTGAELRRWTGTDRRGGFGGVVATLADLDGDGTSDVAVAAPATEDQARTLPGELFVYSGATGTELRHWSGRQPGELFGRMVVAAGDVDGDGVGDVAIGAPWYRRDGSDKVGRVELRSGRTGAVLAELGGDGVDCWFGWHMRRAPDPDGSGRPALLIGSLRHPVDGEVGVGVLDVYVLRRATRAHGTTTRRTRRSDIK